MDTVDKLERYRQIIREILTPYTLIRYSNGDITNEAVFDRENDRYTVISVGWQGNHRVHHSLIHLDIINGKVWIQRDGTEYGIGYELEEAGIPKSDIVPAFHPENIRPYTGYAIA
jgi:XisI protein